MSLNQWADNGWLKRLKTNKKEIADLFGIVERDINDTNTDLSDDWRFGIAYNAALKLCTILLYAEGFRPTQNLQHYRTIMALPIILDKEKSKDADYLNACRIKRNTVEYDYAGGASKEDADELIDFVNELRNDVIKWLNKAHPELIGV